MFPGDFIKRLSEQAYIDSEGLLRALSEPSPVSIRINRRKWDLVPDPPVPVPWNNSGYYLPERPSFTSDPLFHAGCYYPQEASGMFLGEVLEQLAERGDGLKMLDLCGAPGGKTTIMSDFAGDDGLLVSNEVIRSRAHILAETVAKWGRGNTIVTQDDPASFSRLSGFFDVILVDAPCSGEGMFRTETALNEWSPANAQLCCERQRRILSDIWPALKEEGLLIYSTCTFNPGENEQNIKWLAETQQAEPVEIDISRWAGITEIDYQGIRGYGFYPGRLDGEGLFMSVVRKKGKQAVVRGGGRKRQLQAAGPADIKIAGKWTVTQRDRLLRHDDTLLSLPCDQVLFSLLLEHVRVLAAGTKIAVCRGSDYLPAPELALSVKLEKNAFPVCETDYRQAISFLRRDTFTLKGAAPGWNIVTYNDVPLGFLKNLGNRFNNYFPVEWRIRMDEGAIDKDRIVRWLQPQQ